MLSCRVRSLRLARSCGLPSIWWLMPGKREQRIVSVVECQDYGIAQPDFWIRAANLLRIKPEHLELPTPLGGQIAEPFDPDAAGQATFHYSFDKIGCEKGKRNRHVDLPNAALLASAKLSDSSYST
jgi:hypothetical protein